MSEVFRLRGDTSAALDIVFIHGLDGDPRKTWTHKPSGAFWPGWLAQDFPEAAAWTVGYDAGSSHWKSVPLGLNDRATDLRERFITSGIGERPLFVVAHSLGGLVFKKMLEQEWRRIAGPKTLTSAIAGVAFLATPHLGSKWATIAQDLGFFRPSRLIDNLRELEEDVLELNNWYRDFATSRHVAHRVFFETKKERRLALIVDRVSADPNLPDVEAQPVERTHTGICKFPTPTDKVYAQTKSLLLESTCIVARQHPRSTTQADLAATTESADGTRLASPAEALARATQPEEYSGSSALIRILASCGSDFTISPSPTLDDAFLVAMGGRVSLIDMARRRGDIQLRISSLATQLRRHRADFGFIIISPEYGEFEQREFGKVRAVLLEKIPELLSR